MSLGDDPKWRASQKMRIHETVKPARGKRLTEDESRAELRRLLAWKRSILDGVAAGPFPSFAQEKFVKVAKKHCWDEEFRDDMLLSNFRAGKSNRTRSKR